MKYIVVIIQNGQASAIEVIVGSMGIDDAIARVREVEGDDVDIFSITRSS